MQFDSRPPSDQKRLLIFFALALPIWIAGLMWMQRTQKAEAERRLQQGEVAGTVEVQPSPTAELSSPQLQPAGSQVGVPPVTRDAEAAAPARRPTEVEPVRVATRSVQVELSPAGAVPIRWTLIDPRVTNGRHKSPEEIAADDTATSASLGVDLIDPALQEYSLALPFEVVLKEQNAKFYHEFNREPYTVARSEQDGVQVVRFESPVTDSGLRLIKTYRFPAEGFESELKVEVVNAGGSRLGFNNQGQGLGLALGPGLGQAPPPQGGFGGGHYEYTRALYRNESGLVSLKTDKDDEPQIFVDANSKITLAALQDRYFLFGLLPGETFPEGGGFSSGKGLIDLSVFEVALANKDSIDFYPRLEVYGQPFTLEPGATYASSFRIYAGPKERSILKATGAGLEDVLFYDSWSWMRALCIFMMGMLGFFHRMLSNWGLAIIALVVTVRLATFPLAQIGMKQQATVMAQQAKLKPHLDKLNEKYKDNPSKRNQEMMKLYREHNVNPLGMLKGCMWMFIQLPVFLALYKLLSQDFDLRGASFLWIDDLSQADRLFGWGFSLPLLGQYFNLLPVLTAATQMLVSKLTMNPAAATDPQQAAIQKQMMYMMPVMILVMTYQFPSGLCLYWMISNVWQVLQQRFVNRKILHAPAAVATT